MWGNTIEPFKALRDFKTWNAQNIFVKRMEVDFNLSHVAYATILLRILCMALCISEYILEDSSLMKHSFSLLLFSLTHLWKIFSKPTLAFVMSVMSWWGTRLTWSCWKASWCFLEAKRDCMCRSHNDVVIILCYDCTFRTRLNRLISKAPADLKMLWFSCILILPLHHPQPLWILCSTVNKNGID